VSTDREVKRALHPACKGRSYKRKIKKGSKTTPIESAGTLSDEKGESIAQESREEAPAFRAEGRQTWKKKKKIVMREKMGGFVKKNLSQDV